MIATQPTMIAVAAPTAVTCRERIASSANHVSRHAAGHSSVFVNARMLLSPTPKPLPPLNPNHPNHSSPAPSRT